MSTDPTRDSLDAIRRIVHSLRHPASVKPGLGPARLFVLRSLAELPDQSLGELAQKTRTEPSSVSVVISALVEDGYVTRGRAEGDARRVVLRLTRAGKAVVRKAPVAPQERLLAALEALPATKQKQLAVMLGDVIAHMGIERGAPALFFEEPPKGKKR